MIKQFYTDIVNRLNTQLNGSVNHIEIWNQQIENENIEKPFKYPALFIEFNSINYRSEAYGIQKADIEFTVHCCFSQLVRDLDLLDIVESVGVALHNFNGDYFADITRSDVEQDTNHDRVQDWTITFNTTATDCGTAKVHQLTQTTPTSVEVSRDLDIDNQVIRSGDGQ